jgi:hypothetical protein
MSNQLKLAAIVIIIIIIGSGSIFISGVFKPKKDDKLAQVSSGLSSVVSTSSASMVSSTPVSSKAVSFERQVSSLPVAQSRPQSEAVSLTTQQPIQYIPNVIKLSTDKSIYHQYIKDYLVCPTKFYQVLNGGYVYEGLDKYRYKCISEVESKKCPSKTLIYGHKPLVGSKVYIVDYSNPSYDKQAFTEKYRVTVEQDKYYCVRTFESVASISLGEMSGYGHGYFPSGLDSKLPGYFVIPRSILPISNDTAMTNISFAAIPLSSFSKQDQEYIANNFKVQINN